jgi:hypothetical protein
MGTKRVTVKAPAKLPYLLMAYHAPVLRDAAKDWEPYALDMLAGVLDGNPAARLNRVLVREKQVALGVGTGYDSVSRGPALFMLEGTPAEGRTVADVEAALPAALRNGGFLFADMRRNQISNTAERVLRLVAARGEGAVVGREAIAASLSMTEEALDEIGVPDLEKREVFRCAFDGRYKLVRYFGMGHYHLPTSVQQLLADNDVALYDLQSDPDEMDNLADPANPNLAGGVIFVFFPGLKKTKIFRNSLNLLLMNVKILNPIYLFLMKRVIYHQK